LIVLSSLFSVTVPMKKCEKNDEKRNRTILKTIEPIKLILDQKRYIVAEKLNMCQLRMYMCQLRTISSKKKTHILKKNNIGAN